MFDATTVTTDLPDIPGEVLPDVPDLPGDIPDEIPGDVPQGEPQEAHDAHVLVPDAVLDPGALVPVDAILARVQGITAADVARSIALSDRALRTLSIASDDEQDALDQLRDTLKDHEQSVRARIDAFCDIANKLHKGMTGLRNVALDRVPDAIAHAGRLIGSYVRAKEAAEAERQRKAREEADRIERERLQREAEALEAEKARLAAAAQTVEDPAAKQQIEQESARLAADADQVRVEAATMTTRPVAAVPVAKPKGSSVPDNWKAYPAHGPSQDEMPAGDLRELVLFVAERARDNDLTFLHLLSVNWETAKAFAKSGKATMRIPGLRAVNEGSYRKTRRG